MAEREEEEKWMWVEKEQSPQENISFNNALHKLIFHINNYSKSIHVLSGLKWSEWIKNIFQVKERPTKPQDGEISPLLVIFHVAETNYMRKTSQGRVCLLLVPKGS